VSILPDEAKYTLLELCCHQPNMMAKLVTWQVWTAWLNPLGN